MSGRRHLGRSELVDLVLPLWASPPFEDPQHPLGFTCTLRKLLPRPACGNRFQFRTQNHKCVCACVFSPLTYSGKVYSNTVKIMCLPLSEPPRTGVCEFPLLRHVSGSGF